MTRVREAVAKSAVTNIRNRGMGGTANTVEQLLRERNRLEERINQLEKDKLDMKAAMYNMSKANKIPRRRP